MFLFVFFHQGSAGGERSSGPIRCQRCREVCKGEVVRVQDTHFHVKCFTCTGKTWEPDPSQHKTEIVRANSCSELTEKGVFSEAWEVLVINVAKDK